MNGPSVTPDGRYLVVRGRLWRASDPTLCPDVRQRVVDELMSARRAVADANRVCDDDARKSVRQRVEAAKLAFGKRGPVWWTDGAPDLNRRLARNTPYVDWLAAVESTPADPATVD